MSEEAEVIDAVVELLSARQPRRKVQVLREVLGHSPHGLSYRYVANAVRAGRILCDGAGHLSLPPGHVSLPPARIPLANTFEDDVVDVLVAAGRMPLTMLQICRAMGRKLTVNNARRIIKMIDDGEIKRAPESDGGGIFILVED